ncbi:MAG: isochorismatase family protein [Bdellovibrionaceae bacterium]|nr:isochorismatase family protein [Pseudobdellovibrionaceae bacterium]
MNRLKFALSSDQLELLIAFEKSQGLTHLSEMMARDPSVVSRNLQKIAENYPVLKKVKGRWELTPLGIQVNLRTRTYLEDQEKLFLTVAEDKKTILLGCSEDAVLVIINAQNGLFDATQEGRNNSQAEKNIGRILRHWRAMKRKVFHVKHVSDNFESIFFRNSIGCEFLKDVGPVEDEVVIEKMKSSAFANTNLESILNAKSCTGLVLVGFTANECIDATARDSAAKGFETFVVGDATATFDLRDSSGKLVKAERIHKLTLININAFHAKVVNTDDILV